MSDISLKCKDCGKDFIFTEGEQKFYENKKFTNPTRLYVKDIAIALQCEGLDFGFIYYK